MANNTARVMIWAAQNKTKRAAYMTEYHSKNADHLREKAALRRLRNKDQIKATRLKMRLANPEASKKAHKKRYANPKYADKCRQRSKAWRNANPETYNENNKKWRKANPERAKAISRAGWINRRARNKAVGKISADDVRTVRARERCEVCGNIHERMEIDHIVPISRGGTNHLTNLQLLCRPCNRSKWAKDFHTWLAERGLLPDVKI